MLMIVLYIRSYTDKTWTLPSNSLDKLFETYENSILAARESNDTQYSLQPIRESW